MGVTSPQRPTPQSICTAFNAIAYALAAMPSRYAIERGMWKEAAQLVPRQSRFTFSDAITWYERSQVRDPKRLRSLYGAGLAAAQSGDRDKAKLFYARVVALVGTSEARPELKQARAYLAGS